MLLQISLTGEKGFQVARLDLKPALLSSPVDYP
jgi:hypothetical protein